MGPWARPGSNGAPLRMSQASPELLKLFGGEEEGVDNMSLFTNPKAPPPGAASARLPSAPPVSQRATGKQPGMDTPRGFEEELTEEELMRLELEKVKHERDVLMSSILSARAQAGGHRMSPIWVPPHQGPLGPGVAHWRR